MTTNPTVTPTYLILSCRYWGKSWKPH